MSWPLSQDYNEAIQDPANSFSDAELKTGEAAANALGIPMPRSGNFADVYEVRCPSGSRWAVKCFTREVFGLCERYAEIGKYLHLAKLPFMVDFQFLEQGIRVRGQWYPILKMQWVEGFLLNEFVRDNLDKKPILQALGQIWLKMARRLRESYIAHCDLQHGNVLFVPGSKSSSLAVKLIDYDGMCVPSLVGTKSGEVGHPAYQHPERLRSGAYNQEVDRFSLLSIAAALRCLSIGGRSLWERYDTGDNLLFRQADLQVPAQSPLFQELLAMDDPQAQILVKELQRACQGPLDIVPLLTDLLPDEKPAGKVTKTVSASSSAVARQAGAAQGPEWDFGAEESGTSLVKKRRTSRGMPMWAWGAIGGAAALVLLCVGVGVGLFLHKGSAQQNGTPSAQVKAEPKKARPQPKDNPAAPPNGLQANPVNESRKLEIKGSPPAEARTPPESGKLLSPVQAAAKAGQKVTVQLRVQGGGTNGEFVELYSEPAWDREGNMVIRFPESTREKYQQIGISNVGRVFSGKLIRVSGTVTLLRIGDGTYPCIVIDDPNQIKALPGTAVAVNPASAPNRGAGWDRLLDPEGDCQFREDRGKLTITIPKGKSHDLSVENGNMNGPRLLRDIEGDFTVEVHVSADFQESHIQAVGLFLMLDNQTYIRLERGRLRGDAVRLWELRRDGKRVPPYTITKLSKEEGYLRLERRGNKVFAFVSDDGERWDEQKSFEIDLPRKVQIGVSALSVSGAFAATFDRFQIKQGQGEMVQIDKWLAPTGTLSPGKLAWQTVDPDHDCKFEEAEGKLTIAIPAKPHGLTLKRFDKSSPRLLRDVEGDFAVQVRVGGDFTPAPTSSNGEGQLSWIGAGLLLWVDENTFIRLERAGWYDRKPSTLYANWEVHLHGKYIKVNHNYASLNSAETYFRLERRGKQLLASYSEDGQSWIDIAPHDIELPAKVQIGVLAGSSSKSVFAPTFDRFQIKQGQGEMVRIDNWLAPAAPASAPKLAWDPPIDPDRDCQFEEAKGKLTIAVPAKPHGLTLDGKSRNSPRLVSDVEGDFTAQVRVSGDLKPAPASARGERYNFIAAGLLLWVDEHTFFRLERALLNGAILQKYVNWEAREEGKKKETNHGFLPVRAAATYLSLERRGKQILASYSEDGQSWHAMKPLDIELPAKVKIGILASSTTARTVAPTFDQFQLKQGQGEWVRRDKWLRAEESEGWWSRLDVPRDLVLAAKDGVLRMPSGRTVATRQEYSGPLDITVVVRGPENHDVSFIAPGGAMVTFRRNGRQGHLLRVRRPDTPRGELGTLVASQPIALTANNWCTLHWEIKATGMKVGIDKKLVFEGPARYDLTPKSPVKIRVNAEEVEVKSLEVKSLKK